MTQSDGGKEIHKFVKDSSEALKVSKVAANWKAYVDFVARLQGMSSLQLSDWLSLRLRFSSLDHTCRLAASVFLVQHRFSLGLCRCGL